ncbi:MAG: sialic acid synthase [Candidatus Hydrogenedentota bacterium]
MIRIGNRAIGPGHPVYIIAELSANHLGDFARAEHLVRTAKAVGADAIKLQTYTPEGMTLDCSAPPFQIEGGTAWDGKTEFEVYREAATPWEWHAPLRGLALDLGLEFFSTAYDTAAVEALESLGVPAYKIASFELVDLPLIRRIAETGKPVILSTGMATLDEIDDAVDTFEEAGGDQLALLHCISAYPAPPDEMNLRTIPDLAQRYEVPTGLSDHTLGSVAATAAVALGACIIEKHLTLSRSDGGPDASFSAEPPDFRALVESIRTTEQALGFAHYGPTQSEQALVKYRRSLFVSRDMLAGEPFTTENVRVIRPGHGLPPKDLQVVLRSRAKKDVSLGTPLSWDLVERDDS